MFEEMVWHQHDIDIFPGFYGTILEGDDAIEMVSEYEGVPMTFKPGVFLDYMKAVSERYVKRLESEVKESMGHMIRDLKLEEVRSPEYYNFETDKLSIRLKVNKWNVLRELVKNKEDFNRYLREHYTSRSGFISFVKTEIHELWRQKKYFWHVALDYLILKQEFFDDVDDGDGSKSYWALVRIVDDVIPEFLEPVK